MADQAKRPGAAMIYTAAGLLFALGAGLLAVSFAAQYRYVMDQRHQSAASLIEAAALDVGMLIFSLLALGLARAGMAAKTERALVVACAVGSAAMNLAAADVSSPRSLLAYCMPPVFLAVVADRVVVTVRRHVLGMREGLSPWAACGRVALYGLRFALAPWPTAKGVRTMVLDAAPLRSSVTPASEPAMAAIPPAAAPAAVPQPQVQPDAPPDAQPRPAAAAVSAAMVQPQRSRSRKTTRSRTRNAPAPLEDAVADARSRFAATLALGVLPSQRQIIAECGVGQARAGRIRADLEHKLTEGMAMATNGNGAQHG